MPVSRGQDDIPVKYDRVPKVFKMLNGQPPAKVL
jgi:hypothetical protein